MTEKRPLKVLVIDDEESLRDIISSGLEAVHDCSVAVARDGESGLQQIAEFQPDVLLLDLLMPGIDGFQVLEALRSDDQLPRPRRVIAMSALTDRDTMARLRELGADAILPKPFSLSELRTLLQVPPG